LLLKKVDLISTEVEELVPLLNHFLDVDISQKLIYSPNGFDDSKSHSVLPYEKKENIMVTVGRIGSPQKNNEMMLKALENCDLKDWKIYFIGPIEEAFKETIVDFYEGNYLLKEKVFFIGNIEDKNELYSWYNKSKVFFLTSPSEGFPLVFPEALFFGNYIVTTDVGGAKDITNNGQNGTIINIHDIENLEKTISRIVFGDINLKEYYEKNIKLANEKFLYSKIISKLDQKFRSL
jgi:GalNAc-alpha-(1->4)-GalNAc-alpha-(1->3)-diNAcBac-PP-undecaprenol alpha-1,4-N-acetyl-D-galactosaminyltransferase